jgi:hypothetical protein
VMRIKFFMQLRKPQALRLKSGQIRLDPGLLLLGTLGILFILAASPSDTAIS